ncbi:hypothetical protein LguiB_025162 [Lonicera macranthoides]
MNLMRGAEISWCLAVMHNMKGTLVARWRKKDCLKYSTTLEQYLGNNHPGGCKKKPSLKVPRTNDSETPAVVLLFGSQHFPNLKLLVLANNTKINWTATVSFSNVMDNFCVARPCSSVFFIHYTCH